MCIELGVLPHFFPDLSVKVPNTFSLTASDQSQDKLCNHTQSISRLQGIDAPERRQAFGTKSKEHISELVAGQVVTVEYHDLDRYQRILGKVLLDGEDINLEQVSSGMAWHYKKYQREQTTADRIRYSDAEREARKQNLGLWHDPHPVPPRDYRQAEREQRKSIKPFVGKSTVW